MTRKYNIPIFIPHSGCPHDCTFCNQRKITGVDTIVTPKIAENIILNSLNSIKAEPDDIEVAFFGGSFTGLNLSLQEEFLKAANKFLPYIKGVRLSTRPDYINEEILDLLKKYNVTNIELGVQSTDDEVLSSNKRGHNFKDVVRSANFIKEYSFGLGLQMMIGMYKSNEEKDLKTADDIIVLNPDSTRIYPTVTLKNTELERLYREVKYTPYSLDKAVKVAKKVMVKFKEKNIEVIRIGLHSSEDLNEDSIVAGPYHPAFGELVENLVYRDEIESEIIKDNIRNSEYVVSCKNSEVSKIIGQRRSNKLYFMNKYGVDLKLKINA